MSLLYLQYISIKTNKFGNLNSIIVKEFFSPVAKNVSSKDRANKILTPDDFRDT